MQRSRYLRVLYTGMITLIGMFSFRDYIIYLHPPIIDSEIKNEYSKQRIIGDYPLLISTEQTLSLANFGDATRCLAPPQKIIVHSVDIT